MLFYIIFIVLGVLFLLILTLLIVRGYKLKVLNLKLVEAENNISNILKDKYNLLESVNSIMKSKDKEDIFTDLSSIDINNTPNIELNKKLGAFDKTIIELVDYNKEIVFDEAEETVFDKLTKTDINRLAIEKYYNDNATIFNNSLNKFPAGFISKIKKYSKKELYSNEKEEIFEILKK